MTYTISFAGAGFYIAGTKRELIELWTTLLFHNAGREYIVAHGEQIIVKGEMKPEDLKDIEQWQDCSGGACRI